MDRAVAWYRMVGSTRFELDLDSIRERASLAFERCSYPPGFLRQTAAITASPPRGDALRYVRVPATVIHGSIDPLVPLAGGEAVARAIRGAELHVIEGMGHDLPAGAWPQIVDGVTQVAQRAN
jgi:pimeloyl-ACP methyl ester carboxylesterase